MKTYTYEAWHARGRELFGDDEFQFRFVCPICGHVQTPLDFRKYKDAGATPASAYQECIGRYGVESRRRSFGGTGPGPCDYAGYGLFRVSPVRVQVDGKEIHAFAFEGDAVGSSAATAAAEVVP